MKRDLSVASTSLSSEEAMNWKLSKNLICTMLNELYFSELLAMQKMFPFAVCIFLPYEMADIAFDVVKYHSYFTFA